MQILMTSYYQPRNNYSHPAFSARKIDLISPQKLEEVIASELPVKKKAKELQISVQTYYTLLRERGIMFNANDGIAEILARIPVNEFAKKVKDGVKIADICETYEITVHAYRRILQELKMKGYKNALMERAANITEQEFMQCITDKLSVKAACDRLEITPDVYYQLKDKFAIETPRMALIRHNKNVPDDVFKRMIEDKVPYQEVLDTLEISPDTYNKKIAKCNITTDYKQQKINIANIDREKFTQRVLDETPVKEVCEEFNINERTYSRLLDKFEIMTKRKEYKARVRAIAPDYLQELVDEHPPKKICEVLQISESTFYKLLKRLDIKYNYQHHYGEIEIPVSVLEEINKSPMTTIEKAKALGISQTAYHEKAKVAKVKTALRESIDTIENVPVEEFEKDIRAKMSVKKICEKYNITPANYTALIRKRNTKTSQRAAMERIAQISRFEILAWKNIGKTVDEICDIMRISSGTYSRIMSGCAGN